MSTPRWVSKVHPLDRPIEAEDPMWLVANPVAGEPEKMLDCMIEEFAWLGYNADELAALFQSPLYPVLHQLAEHYGEEAIARRIAERLSATASLRFDETLAEDFDDCQCETDDLELVQLEISQVAFERNIK